MAGEYGNGAKSKTTATPFSGTAHSLRESSPANDQPLNDQTDGKAMAGEYGNGAKSKTTTATPFSGTAHSLRESSPANDQPLNNQTDGKAMAGEYSNGAKSKTTTVTSISVAAYSTGESSTANNTFLNDHTDAMAGEYSNGAKSKTTTVTPFSGPANSLRESSTANVQPLNDQTDGKANQNKDTLMIYRKAFGKEAHHKVMRETINLTVGPWLSELKSRKIIDQKCADDISTELDDKEKIIIVVKYLIKMSDINKYTAFINLWKEHDPTYAETFESNIQKQIADQGAE